MTVDTGNGPRARMGLGAMVTWPILFFVGLVLAGSAVASGPVFFGAETTTGTIVASPTRHAVVSFEVDGTTYTVTTSENNRSWQIGTTVTMVYNPRNPQQATTTTVRGISLGMGAAGLAMLVAGVVVLMFGLVGRLRSAQVLAGGQWTTARVVGVHRNPYVHLATSSLVRLTCVWETPGGGTYTFKSPGRFVPNSQDPRDLIGQDVPVAIDPADPARRYVVDDSSLRR